MLIVGCAVSTFCYGLTIRANLGLGPLFAVQQGVARHLGISIGTAVMLVGVGLVLVAVALRSRPGLGTLAVPILGGALLNVMLPDLPAVHGWLTQLTMVIVATWFMGLGGSLVIAAGLGASAYDAVMMGTRMRIGGPIVVIRLAMECSMLALGWLLGGSIGVGTALTALLIAPSMHFWLGVLGVTRSKAHAGLEGASPARRRLAHSDSASVLGTLSRVMTACRTSSIRRSSSATTDASLLFAEPGPDIDETPDSSRAQRKIRSMRVEASSGATSPLVVGRSASGGDQPRSG